MTNQTDAETGSTQSAAPGEREFEELTRITNELVTTQRDLEKQGAKLRKLNDEKNLAIGIVAHDLRNPLALIETQGDFLLNGNAGSLSDAQRELLTSITQQGRLMLSIVNNLLDVSAIEAGRFDLNLSQTCTSALVERSVRHNSLLAADKLVSIQYQRPDQELDAVIDSHKFEQVLNNLIGNAVKYSPIGSDIEVTLELLNDEFELTVRDHGPGIPENQLDSLFSPFITAGVSPSAGESSTGLGLAIVQRIVAEHGGSIRVDSRLNHGSCFTVRMPRCPDGTAAPSTVETPDSTPVVEQPSPPAHRVLIVDDSVAAAKMTARMLNSFCDAVVEFAHDGQSALDKEMSFRPDIVILDIELPIFSGVEVARRLRQRHGPDAPHMYAITGHREAELDQLAARDSFHDLLTKPVSIDQLREVVRDKPGRNGTRRRRVD